MGFYLNKVCSALMLIDVSYKPIRLDFFSNEAVKLENFFLI